MKPVQYKGHISTHNFRPKSTVLLFQLTDSLGIYLQAFEIHITLCFPMHFNYQSVYYRNLFGNRFVHVDFSKWRFKSNKADIDTLKIYNVELKQQN